MQAVDVFDFFTAAHHHGHALMQAGGLDVEHGFQGIGAAAAGLRQNQAQRIGFVHQAQFARFA